MRITYSKSSKKGFDVSKKINPFFQLYSIVSSIMAALSLATIGETILAWKPIILNLIDSYSKILYAIHDFIYGWLPFSIPNLVKDYLTIGFIIGVAFLKDLEKQEGNDEGFFYNLFILFFSPVTAFLLLLILIWPLLLIGNTILTIAPIVTALQQAYRDSSNFEEFEINFSIWHKKEGYYFWQVIGAILFILLIMIIVNSAF